MALLTARSSGLLEFAAAMVLSGTLGIFVFESGESSWNVVFFRCFFGALSLGTYCWAAGLFRARVERRNWVWLSALGGVAIVSNWVLLFSSYRYASISIATAVYHTQPFFLLLLSALFFRDRPSLVKLAWIGVAFVGLMLVIEIDQTQFDLSAEATIGLLLALGAAILYAVATIVTRQLKGVPPHLIALVQVCLGTVLLLPFASFETVMRPGWHWAFLIGLGVIHTCLMYILLYSGLQKLPVSAVAVLSFIYPIVAILVDYILYGQNLSLLQITGIGLILLGSAAVNLNLSPFFRFRRRVSRTESVPAE